MLLADRHLGTILPSKPKFVYKRAPIIRHTMVKKIVDPPKTVLLSFVNQSGFFPCRLSYACSRLLWVGIIKKETRSNFNTTGKQYKIKDCITCNAEGVIYCIKCPCGIQYIGQAKRMMAKRSKEHFYNIAIGYPKHPLSKHYWEIHNKMLKALYSGRWKNTKNTGGDPIK